MTRVAAFLLVLAFSYYVAIVQSYGGRGYNPIGKLMKKKISIQSKASSGVLEFPQHLNENRQDFHVNVLPQDGRKMADKIDRLPGQPAVNFGQYSGYVNVDQRSGRELFYYFVECTKQPATKPLVLWLNGGPGCSSVGAGAMMELGPFRVKRDGKTLMRNRSAWNKKANILFLESPAGVGFSYSRNFSDYKYNGDKKTAQDSYTFLINWLERFPEYKNRDFYMAGESYAGHYVPQLAKLILENNHKVKESYMIRLRGITIGNGLFDDEYQLTGTTDYFYTHAIISDEMRESFFSACNITFANNACTKWQENFDEYIKGIDIYDIYAPLCNSSSHSPSKTTFDPCTRNYIVAYMNDPQVQKALHANTTSLPYTWSDCNDNLGDLWEYEDSDATVLPIIRELMHLGVRVWLYSGDTDGACPVTSTDYSIKSLDVPLKTKWYPWLSAPEDIGGYAVEYENLSFITVRGAGHFVPSCQPERALTMFSAFLAGKLPPQANFSSRMS